MESVIRKDAFWVSTWLFVGLVMVFVQIMVGGVTRLTGSGLSITRWEIVTGTLPPMNAMEWDEAFGLYKETPQYQKINEGMSLSQFKFIFFWEYVHRLWARTMGFVFVIPFFVFLFRKSLASATIKRLGIVVSLAALAAVFGWVMVASGLINRPWVNAYKLTIHLGLGITLFVFLFYTWLKERGVDQIIVVNSFKRLMNWLIGLTLVQIAFGGFISGMKASLNYPSWPKMNGEWIPSILMDTSHWHTDSFLLYDASGFMPAFVQLIHRNVAYIIFVLVVYFAIRWFKSGPEQFRWYAYLLLCIIVVQVALGILTLLGSVGSIPVLTGVLHQGVGILFFTSLFYFKFKTK